MASSSSGAPHILDRIVETKRAEVSALRGREGELRSRVADQTPPRDFSAALRRSGEVSLVAEVKRRSPGAGSLAPGLEPVAQASAYREGGAAALSVLTDAEYFQGSLDDLRSVRETVPLPVLRKDFTVDERQVWEARSAGADAVLLIVRILDDARLRSFRELAEDLGMTALVEVHEARELDRALDSGAAVVGVNNRDLATFDTDLDVTLDLLERIPGGVTLVSESGISTRRQVEVLGERGVDAILVGEALVRSADPAEDARRLSGVARASREG